MNFSPQWLDQLRGRLTLSSIIGRSVKVEKAGREYKACCPFHSENTPSFTINDQKGFYHCFGCGAHGDAIRWMTDHRGLGFMDAVKELAGEAGMDVPAPDPQAAKRAEKRDSLYDVCAAAQDWFAAQLNNVAGAEARAYLEKRGITAETQAKFGFGFAPDGRGNIAKALDGFPTEKLVEAGLLISVDGKTPYDRFRGRLMIPIRDARGRTIAWGGRILGAGEPKYLNSPDTPLFDKGRTLYNINNAAAASRQTGRLIVVEGYMDAIALDQAGFEDVVAPLGTALTEEQIGMAWKMADRPILCLDGDNAGQKAAMRAASRALPLLKSPHSLKFIRLPPGADPDDIVRDYVPSVFENLLQNALPMTEFIWQYELQSLTDLGGSAKIDADGRAKLLNNLLFHCDKIPDLTLQKQYSKEFRDLFYSRYGFRRENITKVAATAVAALETHYLGLRDKYIRATLFGLSRYPAVIRSVVEDLASIKIENPTLSKFRDEILNVAFDEPTVETDFIEQMCLQNPDINLAPRDYTKDLAFSFYHKPTDRKRAESDLFLVIQSIKSDIDFEFALAAIQAQFEIDLDDELFKKTIEIKKRKRFLQLEIQETLSHFFSEAA